MMVKGENMDEWEDLDPAPSTSPSKARKRRVNEVRVGRSTPRSDRRERMQDVYNRTGSPIGSPSRGGFRSRQSVEDLRTIPAVFQDAQTHTYLEKDKGAGTSQNDTAAAAAKAVGAGADYAAGVLGSFGATASLFLSLVKKPLGVLLFIVALTAAGGYLTQYLKTTYVAPLCSIPGVNYMLPFCASISRADRSAKRVDFPALTKLQDKALFPLLSEAASGSELALQMKRTQMATADLVTLVTVSPLTSRIGIAAMLQDFHGEAGLAGVALNKFDAKLSGAVDNILAIQDHALRLIEDASVASNQGLARIVPWFARGPDAAARTGFEQAMDVSEKQMKRLIMEAVVTQNSLNKLEEQLQALHMLLETEGANIPAMNILAQIWARLSGDTRAKRTGDTLRSVDDYRKQARAHVAGVLTTLNQMEADMEDLRARVASPTIVGDKVPLDVQISAIRRGVERLSEGRRRSKSIQEKVVNGILDEE